MRDDISRDELDHIVLRLDVSERWDYLKSSRESTDPGLDPAKSIEVLLANAPEHEIFEDIVRIVENWVATDALAAFEFIDESIESRNRRTRLMNVALK